MSIMDDIPSNGETTYRVTAKELRQFCERIEKLKEDRADLALEIKDVRNHAKSRGYDMKALDEMLKLRALDKDVRDEREVLRTLYADALEIFK